MDLASSSWQSVIGLAAVPSVLPLFVEHLKHAVRAARGGPASASTSISAWPLVTDLLAVGWTLALWQGGLLGGLPGGEELRLTTVVLLGLAAGVAASLGYDGWQRLRAPDGGGRD